MADSRVRIYYGPGDINEVTPQKGASLQASSQHEVTVRLADIMPMLNDAQASDRAWLGDFKDEQVTISSDLYQVIMAYQEYRRSSA